MQWNKSLTASNKPLCVSDFSTPLFWCFYSIRWGVCLLEVFVCQRAVCNLYKSKVENKDVEALKGDPCSTLCLFLKVSWPLFPLVKTAPVLLILITHRTSSNNRGSLRKQAAKHQSTGCNTHVKGEVGHLHHQVELGGATSCYQTELGASKKKWCLPHSCKESSFSNTVCSSTKTSVLGPHSRRLSGR